MILALKVKYVDLYSWDMDPARRSGPVRPRTEAVPHAEVYDKKPQR